MWTRILRRLFFVTALAILVWGGYELVQRQRGLAKAIEFSRFELWDKARTELGKYLQLHPGDTQARFMMAELWINDDELLSNESLPRALSHLQRIPDSSTLGAKARTYEAKLLFLVSHQPVAAERLLRKAIQLEENRLEAHLLLCKVMEMTGRHDYCEPIFWKIYELSDPADRAVRLRDWYMSQFFPLTANDYLDRQMGFTDATTGPLPTEVIRYVRFRETEPDAPLGRAALARWTRRSGKPAEALSLLDVDKASPDNELRDAFYVATWMDCLMDLGEYAAAAERLQKWPGAREGFDYWRLKAMILDEVDEDYEAALEAYDLALATWPGPTDWRLMHRRIGCLVRSGKQDAAAQSRAEAEEVTGLMKDEVHNRLRYVLGFLDNPEFLREVGDFYRKLGRSREAEAWTREAARRIANTLE